MSEMVEGVVRMGIDAMLLTCVLTTYGAFVAFYAPKVISGMSGSGQAAFVGMATVVVPASIAFHFVGILPAHNYEGSNND